MRTVLILILSITTLTAPAQEMLAAYIDTGLQSNLLLQQRHVSLAKAVVALNQQRVCIFHR